MAKGNSSYRIDWKKIFPLQITRLAHSMRRAGEAGVGQTAGGRERSLVMIKDASRASLDHTRQFALHLHEHGLRNKRKASAVSLVSRTGLESRKNPQEGLDSLYYV